MFIDYLINSMMGLGIPILIIWIITSLYYATDGGGTRWWWLSAFIALVAFVLLMTTMAWRGDQGLL